jgi:hypothetical protein
MTILIGKYEFDGPYTNADELEEKPGLFAFLRCEQEDYELIHLAESDNVKTQIEISPTVGKSAAGSTVIIALYTQTTSGRDRKKMVEEILNEFESECVLSDSEFFQMNSESKSVDFANSAT